MNFLSDLLIGVCSALHILFLYLEMFLWTRPLGMKIFRRSEQQAKESASIAANQGLYNGFLAAGLAWSLLHPEPSFAFQLKVFFLSCVVIAGLYGAATVSRRILYVQAGPAGVALLILFF